MRRQEWAIVIGSTQAGANHQANLLRAARPRVVPPRIEPAFVEALGVQRASRGLEGARPDEILIFDYLQWGHFSEPGTTTQVWYQIQILKAMNPQMKVTFLS